MTNLPPCDSVKNCPKCGALGMNADYDYRTGHISLERNVVTDITAILAIRDRRGCGFLLTEDVITLR